MNKEKLLELSDTLRGIAEGTHVASFEQWLEDGWIKCKFSYKHEPQPPPPDPYAELKAAHAAGKTIQYRACQDEPWENIDPTWGDDPHCYRIKPEPHKVPLGSDDVNVGDQLRFSETGDILADGEHEGSIILSVATFGVLVASCEMGESIGFVKMFTWEQLMPHRIKRSTDAEFQPCYKVIEE